MQPQTDMTPSGSSLADVLDLLRTKREAGTLCRSLGFGPEATFDALLGVTELAETLQRHEPGPFRFQVSVISEGTRFGLELKAEGPHGPDQDEKRLRRNLLPLAPLIDTISVRLTTEQGMVVRAVKWGPSVKPS